jgi:hypothetical protein
MLASKQRIGDQISHFFSFIQVDIWRIRLADLPFGKSFLIKQLRMIILAFRGYDEDRCLLRASAGIFFDILYTPFHRSGRSHVFRGGQGFWV